MVISGQSCSDIREHRALKVSLLPKEEIPHHYCPCAPKTSPDTVSCIAGCRLQNLGMCCRAPIPAWIVFSMTPLALAFLADPCFLHPDRRPNPWHSWNSWGSFITFFRSLQLLPLTSYRRHTSPLLHFLVSYSSFVVFGIIHILYQKFDRQRRVNTQRVTSCRLDQDLVQR